MAISRRLRYEILRRDNNTCRYCGGRAPDVALTVDHVTPVALGGGDEPSNLVAACKDCNAGKSASNPDESLVANVETDAIRWAQAMRRAATRQTLDRWELHDYVFAFDDLWRGWSRRQGDQQYTFEHVLATDYVRTLEIWQRNSISVDDLQEAIRITMTKPGLRDEDLWRYCCGVVWRMLNERQQIAQEILSGRVDFPDEPSSEPGSEPADTPDAKAEPQRRIPGDVNQLMHAAWRDLDSAIAAWPDVTFDEIYWGYPRFHQVFGLGLRHRISQTATEGGLADFQEDAIAKTLSYDIKQDLAEAVL